MTRAEWLKNLKIGDTVYYFDENHRVYPEKKPGERYSHGAPIYREHFRATKIEGETTKSWITSGWGNKYSKKEGTRGGDYHGNTIYSEQEVEDRIFINENHFKLSEAVMRCQDVEKMRKIKEILEG